MGTNKARPDDLDAFSRGSRTADGVLSDSSTALRAAYDAFRSGCGWGVLEAGSLLNAVSPQFVTFNEQDARWVETIAEAFRRADAAGELPDAAIAAMLRQAGLGDIRGSVTFDDPVAYGFPPTSGYANDPVNTATGNFVELETDLSFGGLLAALCVSRTYNSRSDRGGPFGSGWSSWASARLRAVGEGAHYEGPDGRRARFARKDDGFTRARGIDALVEPLDDGLALAWFGGARWEFDAGGLPRVLTRGPGTAVHLRHDDEGRLVELAHEAGRQVQLSWDGERIAGAVASDGREVVYGYDDGGHLVAVGRAGGTRSYEVDDEGQILSVTDADGVVEVVNEYDAEGRVVEQRSPFGRRTHFTYLPGRVTVTSDGDGGPPNTYVHDAMGRVTEIIDGDGKGMSFAYDSGGRPARIVERGGAVTEQEWDERARLVRRVLPTGLELAFAHDEQDRLVEVTAATGAVTRLRYDGDERSPSEIVDPEGGVSRMTVSGGLVRELEDPDGVALRFEFDAGGNLVATIDADGNVARLERDDAGRIAAATTPLGRRTTFGYDDRAMPVERRDPGGGTWRYEHSAAGRMRSVTDPTGARQEVRYGEHGGAVASVDPLGHVTAREYDVFGNVASVVAPDGATWTYRYDALMRLTAIDDPTAATWHREYDADGNLVATVDPVGTRHSADIDPAGRVQALGDGATSSAFAYDELGRATSHARPDGTEVMCEYDLCGRRVAIVDPCGETTRFEYSAGGKVLREIAPSGRVDAFAYDRCGRLTARIDGAGRRWAYGYNADGALARRTDPDGAVSRLDYDDDGRVAETHVPGRGTARYEYDGAGRTIAVTDRAMGRRTFEYDAAGRLVAATDANGGVTRFAYDGRGYVTEIVDPLGAVTTRDYDPAGRLVRETDPLGRALTVAYDAAGRMVQRTDGSGRSVRWSYDGSGRVSSYGPPEAEPIAIERDALERAVMLDEPGSFHNELAWDAAGRLVERRRDDLVIRWHYGRDGERSALTYPDGSETTFKHDEGGFLVGLRHSALGAIELERDPAGRLVGAAGEAMRASWRYADGDLAEYRCEAAGMTRTARLERDGIGRVVQAVVDGAAHSFSYDRAGQLLGAATEHGAATFAYDACGRLASEEQPSGSTVRYEHDAAGQLRARRVAGGDEMGYEYDGAGRRLRESGGRSERTWRWDELGRLEALESVEAGERRSIAVAVDALGELASVDQAAIMWDTASAHSPLSWLDGQSVVGLGSPWALVGGDGARWLAPDWQGSPGDIARDPWGAPLDPSASGGSARLGYRGELEFGGETWLRNRLYDAPARAFVQTDPLAPIPGSAWAANPYHYAGNNPAARSDPLGLRPISDEELQGIRDRMDRNIFERGADFVEDNFDYIAAGALVIAGGVLMATGVGGPLGVGLISAGVSAGMQRFTTGEVNWGQVVLDGAIGVVTAGAGSSITTALSSSARLATTNPVVRGVVIQGAESVGTGMIDRGLRGDNPFDPRGLGQDLLLGGAAVAVPGGVLGGSGHTGPPAVHAPALHGGGVPPISMDEAIERGTAHVGGVGDMITTGGGNNYMFIRHEVDAAGDTTTSMARFDINPADPHVQRSPDGPHLNLEVHSPGGNSNQHIPIDPTTIRPGDHP